MNDKTRGDDAQDPIKVALAQQHKLLTEAKKRQEVLTKDIKLLSNEVRTLRDQIAELQTAKDSVSNNQAKITSITNDIERIQKEIRAEINKLSAEANVSKQATPTMAEPSFAAPPPPAMGPPPPPPPPKAASKVRDISAPKPVTAEPKPENMAEQLMRQLSGGVSLKQRTSPAADDAARTKTTADMLQKVSEEYSRYDSGNKAREAQKSQLIEKVAELESALVTVKASQNLYHETTKSQTDVIPELEKKKGELVEGLQRVKERVGTELEKIGERKAAEAKAAEERTLAQQNALTAEQSSDANASAIPIHPPPPSMAPPPPPPPPMNKSGSPQARAAVSNSEPKPEVVKAAPATLNVDEIQRKSAAGQARRIEQKNKVH